MLTLESATIDEIIWSGVIVPPKTGTVTYTIRVQADQGDVVISIDGGGFISDAGPAVDASQTASWAQNDLHEILITYTSVTLPTAFVLEWKYAGSGYGDNTYFPIPPSAFQAPLRTAKSVELIRVQPGPISDASSFQFAGGLTTFTGGQTYTLTITAKDEFGNLRGGNEIVCADGSGAGGLFNCLFTISDAPPAGEAIDTVSSATANADGTYSFDVTFVDSTQDADIAVKLLTSGGAVGITGSPLPISVVHS